MRGRLVVFVMLVSSLTFGLQAPTQAAQSSGGEPGEKAAAQAPPAQAPGPQVPPDAPVITLDGPCPTGTSTPESSTKSQAAGAEAVPEPALAPVSPKPTGSSCKVVVTRAEFEQLVNALHPGGTPWTARNFATQYSETLLLAEKAHESGFDQDPAVYAKGRYGYLQFISRSFNVQLREKAKVVSDAEVAAYYKEHPEMFEQIELARVFIPTIKEYARGSSTSPEVLAADKAQMDAEAQKIYKQALAGASFEKLEERAYKAANNSEDAPATNLGKHTRNSVPEQFRDMVFALKVGEISPLTPESNGWSIFKVISRRTIPLSEAKQQVQQLKADAAVDELKKTTKIDLNQSYFAAPAPTTHAPEVHK